MVLISLAFDGSMSDRNVGPNQWSPYRESAAESRCGDHSAGRIHPKHERSCFRGAYGNIRSLDDSGIAR